MPTEQPASKGPSIRESLSKVVDAAGPAPEPTPTPASATPGEPARPEGKAGPIVEKKPVLKPVDRGPDGKFLRKDDAAPTGEVPQPDAAAAAPGAPAQPAQAQGAPADGKPATEGEVKPKSRAPASWRAGAKEAWEKVPPEAQAEILRREGEVREALSKAAATERRAQETDAALDELRQAAKPYQALLQAEGGSLAKAFGGYLGTVHALTNGTPATRAAIGADMIHRFGINVELLADALEGKAAQPSQTQPQPAPAGQQAPNPADFRDPRVDEILAHAQQNRRSQVEQLAATQAAEWSAFESDPQNEFLEQIEPGQGAAPGSVRWYMAELIEMHDRENAARVRRRQPPLALSMKDIYSRACLLNPEVREALRQREEAQRAVTANAATRQAQAASSSVRTEPTSSPAPKPQGLRAQLLAAASAHGL